MITRNGARAAGTALNTDAPDFGEPEIVGTAGRLEDIVVTSDSVFSPSLVVPTKTLHVTAISAFDDIRGGPLGNPVVDGSGGVAPAIPNNIEGTNGDDVIEGTSGDDAIFGFGGGDFLLGGAGHDHIDGGYGDDFIDGGAGNDSLIGRDGIDVLMGRSGNDILAGWDGADGLYGGDGDDKLHGDTGDDGLYGGDGHDDLYGGAGADEMWGGNGGDWYFVDDAGDNVVEAGGNPGDIDRVFSEINSYVLPSNVEALDMWVPGYGAGNSGDNFLFGSAGTDIISGMDGDDTIDGGHGGDTLTGGAGSDTFQYRATIESYGELDTITDFTAGVDKLDLSTIDANTGTPANDMFTPIAGAAYTAAGQVGWFYDASIDRTLVTANTDADLNTSELVIYLNGNINLTASDFIL